MFRVSPRWSARISRGVTWSVYFMLGLALAGGIFVGGMAAWLLAHQYGLIN